MLGDRYDGAREPYRLVRICLGAEQPTGDGFQCRLRGWNHEEDGGVCGHSPSDPETQIGLAPGAVCTPSRENLKTETRFCQ